MNPPTEQIGSSIVVGAFYSYSGAIPPGCHGHRYRVLGFVLDVPVNVQKVLVEAQTGPDAGLLFVCSPINFSLRYIPEKPEEPCSTPPS
jgi:hypothetical protein